jgi:glutamate-1-semialdehyde 2,1-aminomutase
MIARAATGRRKVLVARGAYHGTYPWCTPVATGTTPEDRAHVVPFAWNDLAGVDAALDAHAGDVAAIMVTPFRHDAYHDQEMAAPGFLAGLRARCGRLGAVLILDDVRAGFRLHVGGSGEHVGVQPDLTCYSKALANGYALSALVGRDALRDAVTRTFVTGTYWPGAVAMAAALACLDELAGTDAIPRMAALGERLRRGMEAQAAAHRLAVRYTGPPAIPFMTFVADEGAFRRSRTFAAACIQRGVYLHPHHNWFLSAAHTEEDVDAVLDATEEAFREVAR